MSTGKPAAEAIATAARWAKVSGYKKYTVQPSGIWARFSNWFSIDPRRSTGVPLNTYYRDPTPGGNDPLLVTDPVTVPSADIANNPYWKRDVRRAYPKKSFIKQPDVVALLSVGSAAAPKEDVLQIGEAGTKQLVQVKEEGEKGLSAFFQRDNKAAIGVLDANGLPPHPPSIHPSQKRYALNDKSKQTYGDRPDGDMYPCRTFV